jgi:glutamine synthetase
MIDPSEGLLQDHAGHGSTPADLPKDVHTIELVVADASGILRGKRVPASRWKSVAREGMHLANVIYEWSPTCDIREEAPYSRLTDGVPDVHLVPLVETLRLVPWRPGTARVLCEAREHGGGPVPVDPRHALVRVLEDAASLGLSIKTALEVEFYLLDPTTHLPREDSIQCYSIERGARYEDVLEPMRTLIEAFGIPVEACNTEYAPGQFEVNVSYDDALVAVDGFAQFRNAVKEIADQHGFLATFMAKPFTDQSGSGLHVHQSAWRDGENVFSDADGHLSELGRRYAAGLLEHLPAFTLFGSPTPNAFKRRRDYSFCPTRATWGGDNRTVAVRVIEGAPSAVRIEQRDGSADCNPYLIVAAQVAAGLDGIRRELELPPPCETDGYAHAQAPRLADSVPEAVAALRTSELAKQAFDPVLIETFIGYCETEHEAINAQVSDVERRRYLEAF